MEKLSFESKRAAVLGMGISGRSATQFLLAHSAFVHGVDRNAHLLANDAEILDFQKLGFTLSSETDFHDIKPFDFLVLSPGIPLSHPLAVSAREAKVPIFGEIELGCQMAKNPILGITGTNGKTTVTLLVAHILQHSGISAEALGNIGVPFTRELLNLERQTTIVLELSSYQLETLYQPCLEAGLILNITPDHLDRYQTMEAYAKAKCAMQGCLKPGSHLYMQENTWLEYGYLLNQTKPRLYGYQETSFIYTDLFAVFRDGKKMFDLPFRLRNKKSHDLENLLGAYALCSERGITESTFLNGWLSFRKPAHRIEFIAEHQGVHYYDDSKGTNIDAVMRAVQVLEGSIILIAGGVDKGAAYTPWIECFRDKVKLICAIGQAAGKIHDQLASRIPVIVFNSLEEAVLQASRFAQKGENVLLSPGCASFDMFKDYAHRGQEFQRIVHKLALNDII